MRNILVPKVFGFAKNFRFSSFAPPTSVHLYCLFNVTSSRSYDVTCQSYDVESFQNIKHDSNQIRNISFGITLACSDVCCQRTELEIRVSL